MSTEFDEAVPGEEGIEESVDVDADAEFVDEDDLADTVALPESEGVSTDNVGDVSVEINVEQLIADIESEDEEEVAKKKAVRLKLEELAEEKSFEDTYAIEFDSD
jgi:hypothetical protein